MTAPRRIGVLGLGSIGKRMLAAMAEHPDVTAHAAWDPDDAVSAAALSAHPGVRRATNPLEVIGDTTVDVIYVASPPVTHREHVMAALAAGKPVLCEKPLGVDVAASRELVGRAAASGLPNMVNFLFAAARSADTLVEVAAGGGLGELLRIEVRLNLPRWAARRMTEAPWLARSEQGGFMREVGSHYLYLARRLAGPLHLEHADVVYPPEAGAAERLARAHLRAGTVPVSIVGATDGAGPEVNQCVVWGSHASYRIRDFHGLDEAVNDTWVTLPAPSSPLPERETHLRLLDRLVAALDGVAPHPADFKAALEVQEMVEAILSAHHGDGSN